MKQFLNTVEKIKEDIIVKGESLYDLCNNELRAWGNAQYLADKLRAISNVCHDRLEKGFSKTVEGKGVVESYAFKGNVDNLYLYVANYLLDNAPNNLKGIASVSFRYDWDEVASGVKNTVAYTLQLNKIMTEAVRKYNVKYVNGFDERTRLPSFVELSSGIMHYHFPQSAFLYDHKLRQKATKLFLATEECALDDIIVSNDVKEDLFSRYVNVVNYLRETFAPQYEVNTSFWIVDYINYCAYVYVLGCFVNEHLTVDDDINMFALVNMVISKVYKRKH